MTKGFIFLIAFNLALTSCGKLRSEDHASGKTVHIEQTPVKDQGESDLCWAYTITAFAESMANQNSTEDAEINLSPGYLAFHRILRQLQKNIDSYGGGSVYEAYDLWQGMLLIDSVGIVPEGIFPSEGRRYTETVNSYFEAAFRNPARVAEYKSRPDILYRDLGIAFGGTPPRPDEIFSYRGKSFTPRTYLREKIKFQVSNFESVEVNATNFNSTISRIKGTLIKKIAVPTTLDLLLATQSKGVFDPGNCSDPIKCVRQSASSKHAMLGVDYATKGGRFGAMSDSEIDNIRNNDLLGIVLKNTYNFGSIGLDQTGNVPANPTWMGYKVVTMSYLKLGHYFRVILPVQNANY